MAEIFAQQAQAQGSNTKTQLILGRISPDSRVVYNLLDIKPGSILNVQVENESGNLDPVVFLLDGDADLNSLIQEINQELYNAVVEGRDPIITLPTIYDRYALVWNDDKGDNSAAEIQYIFPDEVKQQNYQLIVAGVFGAKTFGQFRLRISLHLPTNLEDQTLQSNAPIAVLNRDATPLEASVKEIVGEISSSQPQKIVTLRDLDAGDIVYAYIETESGNLKPVLTLVNFNNKPLRNSNVSGAQTTTSFEFPVKQNSRNYKIRVEGSMGNGEITTGEYRLLIGVNAPEILEGQATATETSPLAEPIQVRVGAQLQQITDVNQRAEKFNAVATLRMDWNDPKLAFNPDECQCNFITYTGDSFSAFADKEEILWPEFSILNQQGNRWVQNRNVVVYSDGHAIYLEHFTTDFQAPLFDFLRFPFDQQQLYIQTVSVAPENYFVYSDPEELSGIGNQLGEEEWYITSSETQITSENGYTSFWLLFKTRRHLNFYIFRIFIPIGLVILVSWITFWLKDYHKRIDVSSANLLMFVAYNFTIAADLPRIGYLTFMDAILIGSFIVAILVILYNVILRRMEINGYLGRARKIDNKMIWMYPILYLVGVVIGSIIFLK